MNPSTPLHKHALAALEAADLALAHARDLDVGGPCRAEDITPQTLKLVLASGVPGAELDNMSLLDAHDGMTIRRKWKLEWNRAGRDAGLPPEIFVKATPEEAYVRETLAVLHMAENEVNFYRQVQPEIPELAPRAYYAQSYAGGRFLILVEELKGRGLKPYLSGDHCSLGHAKAVVAALAQLHATFWETERFNTDLVWIRPRTQRFGFEWHQQSFKIAREQYLSSDLGGQLPKEVVELVRLWDHNERAVLDYWETLPQTVLHGDSHLGNTYAYPDGRAGFFDWQVIYRGCGLREVAYFFLGAVEPQLREGHEREVVDHYLDRLAAHGVVLDRQAAWLNYCLFVLDRLDAHMKTDTRGGYGHAAAGRERGRQSTIGSILDNDVLGLLRRVLANGSV